MAETGSAFPDCGLLTRRYRFSILRSPLTPGSTRGTEPGERAVEIQGNRNLIAERTLGLPKDPQTMARPTAEELETILRERLDATEVRVEDESHLHAGHAGARGGQGHYRALVVSGRFAGLSKVAAQRVVYQALADEMRTTIHALALTTRVPD